MRIPDFALSQTYEIRREKINISICIRLYQSFMLFFIQFPSPHSIHIYSVPITPPPFYFLMDSMLMVKLKY